MIITVEEATFSLKKAYALAERPGGMVFAAWRYLWIARDVETETEQGRSLRRFALGGARYATASVAATAGEESLERLYREISRLEKE